MALRGPEIYSGCQIILRMSEWRTDLTHDDLSKVSDDSSLLEPEFILTNVVFVGSSITSEITILLAKINSKNGGELTLQRPPVAW